MWKNHKNQKRRAAHGVWRRRKRRDIAVATDILYQKWKMMLHCSTLSWLLSPLQAISFATCDMLCLYCSGHIHTNTQTHTRLQLCLIWGIHMAYKWPRRATNRAIEQSSNLSKFVNVNFLKYTYILLGSFNQVLPILLPLFVSVYCLYLILFSVMLCIEVNLISFIIIELNTAWLNYPTAGSTIPSNSKQFRYFEITLCDYQNEAETRIICPTCTALVLALVMALVMTVI